MKKRIGHKGEPEKSKKGAGIFFTDGTHVLLLKRSKGKHEGKWDLPGGGARDGETDIGAAIRETKEETGLSTIPGHRFDSFDSKNGHKRFTTFLYRVRDQFDCDLSNEHSEWAWVAFSDIRSKDLHPKLEDNMNRYLKSARKKVRTFTEWSAITDLL